MTAGSASAAPSPTVDNAAWKEIVAKYQKPSTWRALWQIIDTLVPIALLWYLMYRCRPVSWWLVVPLAVLAGALLVRVFIIFHDCGHGSFFKSPAANDLVGFLAGILTFTPYYHWRCVLFLSFFISLSDAFKAIGNIIIHLFTPFLCNFSNFCIRYHWRHFGNVISQIAF